jgi:hypothetical protein
MEVNNELMLYFSVIIVECEIVIRGGNRNSQTFGIHKAALIYKITVNALLESKCGYIFVVLSVIVISVYIIVLFCGLQGRLLWKISVT